MAGVILARMNERRERAEVCALVEGPEFALRDTAPTGALAQAGC